MSKRIHLIQTPQGVLVQSRNADGGMTARLTWYKGFGPQKSAMFNDAQDFIDSETIRRMDPYTPMDSSFLKKSPLLLTVIGSGEINQNTPYARKHYYTPANFAGAPTRGPHWFDRMKNEGGKEAILRGAKLIIAKRR